MSTNQKDFAKSIKKLEGQIEKAKEKRKDFILTEGVNIIIERMRKNDITSIDLQKLDSDWGYGTVSRDYEEVYLTLKLNDDGSLYYIAQGYGFEDGELYLDDEPSDEEIVDSNISDKLLDYLKELAVDSLNIEEEDYIGEYEGEGEADIDEIRYRL